MRKFKPTIFLRSSNFKLLPGLAIFQSNCDTNFTTINLKFYSCYFRNEDYEILKKVEQSIEKKLRCLFCFFRR